MIEPRVSDVLQIMKRALEYYGQFVYSSRMGLLPSVQWVAENAIRWVETSLGQSIEVERKEEIDDRLGIRLEDWVRRND
ncbi:MAG TPA: hypothetical protein VJG32_17990 [Anaerolineae bacterium]|nr:hypothetical protein [Anaerolineae bacterium]